MNKKTLLPLAFVPLAATNLQAQSNMQIGIIENSKSDGLFTIYHQVVYKPRHQYIVEFRVR